VNLEERTLAVAQEHGQITCGHDFVNTEPGSVRKQPQHSEEIWGEDIPTFGVGHATAFEDKRSRKKKHPLGFAPPKAKPVKKKKVDRRSRG
jgi:hypothetical protein